MPEANLAINTTADQSSTRDGAEATRAVDGDFRHDFDSGKEGKIQNDIILLLLLIIIIKI